jgi:hypothetical protein
MTEDRIEKLKNDLEFMNSNIADDLTVYVENWIIENKITRPEAEIILEKMQKGMFLYDRLEGILGSYDETKMFNRKIFADD